jgi:hypothetical protein
MGCQLKIRSGDGIYIYIYIYHRFISSGIGAYRIPHLCGKTTEKVKTKIKKQKKKKEKTWVA